MAKQLIKFTVEGMSCSHCENSIKKAVGALDGVDSVATDLKRKLVTVEFDPGRTGAGEIKNVIEEQGYDVI